MITELKPNEVFVFGSNSTGFHGAGSAGLACRGDSTLFTWNNDKWFEKAMKSPIGSPDRIGKWAIYGISRGYQRGREGSSYAIETVKHPEWKRTVPLSEIKCQLLELFQFANDNPSLSFIMTPVGARLAGWTDSEMRETWDSISDKAPKNVIVPENLYISVNTLNT